MKKIKQWDTVVVIAGKHKGKVSHIMKLDGEKAYVEGVNIVKKAVKGEWYKEKVLPIHISNIMYYVKSNKQAVRIGFEMGKNGKKSRKVKQSGEIIKD